MLCMKMPPATSSMANVPMTVSARMTFGSDTTSMRPSLCSSECSSSAFWMSAKPKSSIRTMSATMP